MLVFIYSSHETKNLCAYFSQKLPSVTLENVFICINKLNLQLREHKKIPIGSVGISGVAFCSNVLK